MNEINEKIEEVVKSCKNAIYCQKGNFYPNKNYGSKIRQSLDDEKLLLSFARFALKDIDGVYVKSAKAGENSINLQLLINDEQRQVKINL